MNPDDLTRWMHQQRWFAGRGRTLERVSRTEIAVLHVDPLVRLDAIEVQFTDGGMQTYQVPLAHRETAPPELAHALIGHGDPDADGQTCFVYDAMHDKEATRAWLVGMAAEHSFGGLHFHREGDAALPTDADSLLLSGEQSNSTVVFGEQTILKVFRRLADGLNPDAELLHALHDAGNPYVPQLQGWVEGHWKTSDGSSSTATLAIATQFLPMASSGWDLALTSVRGLLADPCDDPGAAGGDLAGEAARLGEATAAVHVDLARMLDIDTAAVATVITDLTERLIAAVRAAPDLEATAPAILEFYNRVQAAGAAVPVQRVHGDLHLGQTLRIPAGWRLMDFEGEPGAPTAERRALQSPLKDVAGMLRSFDYAAHHLLGSSPPGTVHPELDLNAAHCARAWATRNQEAFCAGYRSVAGANCADTALLHAYMLDKAVYEVVYEVHHRPDWRALPLAAITRLLDDGPGS